MFTLLISIAALILGYVIYGRFVERIFGPVPGRKTPAITKNDGVDFIPMKPWKIFMIQFLNIAGTGPIFGAILGARYGSAAYLWIVIGCIFGGAMHDYFSGMLSLSHGGEGLPELVGRYLGNKTKRIMQVFSIVMLLLVGAVFVYSPAVILGNMVDPDKDWWGLVFAGIIMIYYMLATLVPIDKIIGKIYPIFAISLIFMALGLFTYMLIHWPSAPEIWDGLQNRSPQMGNIFPGLFISIACGAISGFHATQSPLMARCMTNEKQGRPIFYGAMIVEGIIALIWCTVSAYFFNGGGKLEMAGAADINSAPEVVNFISKNWLGMFGGILAILGVVAAPITSGDTALRSARLIVAETFNIDQSSVGNRYKVSIPIFAVTLAMLAFNILDANGFDIIWRYFGWANQTMAVFTLWTVTAFLSKKRKGMYYLVSLFPACFMTGISIAFISTATIGFNLPDEYALNIGMLAFSISFCWFFIVREKNRHPDLAEIASKKFKLHQIRNIFKRGK